MVKVIVAGAGGRMGGQLVSLIKESPDLKLVGAVERKGYPSIGADAGDVAGCGRIGVAVTDNLTALAEHAEVLIDFTKPDVSLAHMEIMAAYRKAVVIGTTGFSPKQLADLQALAKQVACVFSPNMSVGINVILKALAEMARTFGDEYDIDIQEAHHRSKKDAPSGTALKIAQVLAEATGRSLDKGVIGERKRGEIGIQVIRAGDIVGDHTVLFSGQGERIEVTHRASSRDTFARGALRAARWVATRPPGLYGMTDVLGLK
ncbi:MAG: 4-hydroxy-tetrahydrodipicolinate reductase [Nitrospirae bacterium]|nr:MAG: 4-hydroxy-tetrahydrodipicolinate reductase [Nitrospirota bacterium]